MRLRRRGSPVAQIARYQGVSSSVVVGQTARFGPFPPPVTRQQMIDRRLAGERLADIAAEFHCSLQWVSRMTRSAGPYPSGTPDPQTVVSWVEQRQAGARIADIAENSGFTRGRVQAATRSHGPFPRPRQGPPTLWSHREIARQCGVAGQTVSQWRNGPHDFPSPVPQSRPRRPLWSPDAVRSWVEANLRPCPDCSARVLSIAKHQGAVHRRQG